MEHNKNKQYCCSTSSKNESNHLNKDEELAILAKALGNPVRVQILRALVQKETCICGEIVELVNNLAQSTVSQHLKILKEAGLIRGEIDGTSVCYCINNDGMKRLRILISEI